MEQRRVRLGDVLDDYCPRERRITNHAVVAMIEDQIRQTRCVTCDAEHVYKGARLPSRRKKKDTPGALYEQVLATMPEGDELAGPAPLRVRQEAAPPPSAGTPVREPDANPAVAPANEADQSPPEEGPVHRPLIRATLPRPEGQTPARPAPDFTIRQSGGHNGHFGDAARGGARPGRGGNGHKPHMAAAGRLDRPAGRPSGPRGPGRPSPHARPGRPAPVRSGRKRSR
jgi:hypothetical protein